MSDLFPARDFDRWAANYDDQVWLAGGFPFEGYAAVLDKILAEADVRPGMQVLDLGTGTGNLAVEFVAAGCELWAVDFSLQMLLRAKTKLKGGHCLLADLRNPLPISVGKRFDCIVSAYAFHHFDLAEKVELVCDLVHRFLMRTGRLVIGDIAFADRNAQEKARKMLGENWEEEFYWIAADAVPALQSAGLEARYYPVSFCGGVFTIREQSS